MTSHAPTKPLAEYRFDELLTALAAKTPAPGGGAVASAIGALATALGGMVTAYSLGKKDLAEHQARLQSASSRLARARGVLLKLGDEDAAAYSVVNELQRLPEGDARRERELPEAARACAAVPMFVLATCVDVLEILAEMKGRSNARLESDLFVAAILAEAAARASMCNVEVNLPLLSDAAQREVERANAIELVTKAKGLLERVVG